MRRGMAEPRPRGGLWLRGLWPDRNPLRRASDRMAAAIVAATLLAFLVGAPLAALAAGRWAQAAALQVARSQYTSWRQVPAVVLPGAPGTVDIGYGGVSLPDVLARWTAPDGASRRGYVAAPSGSRPGATVRIWVDQAGRLTGPPLRADQVSGQGLLAMVIAPFALGGILLCAGALGIQAVDRRRLAAWDAEWGVTGPRWTSLRLPGPAARSRAAGSGRDRDAGHRGADHHERAGCAPQAGPGHRADAIGRASGAAQHEHLGAVGVIEQYPRRQSLRDLHGHHAQGRAPDRGGHLGLEPLPGVEEIFRVSRRVGVRGVGCHPLRRVLPGPHHVQGGPPQSRFANRPSQRGQ
jgi:hypothetical protein